MNSVDGLFILLLLYLKKNFKKISDISESLVENTDFSIVSGTEATYIQISQDNLNFFA